MKRGVHSKGAAVLPRHDHHGRIVDRGHTTPRYSWDCSDDVRGCDYYEICALMSSFFSPLPEKTASKTLGRVVFSVKRCSTGKS